MEVCCFVVDFEIAKTIIEKADQTEFENYTRIYDEVSLQRTHNTTYILAP